MIWNHLLPHRLGLRITIPQQLQMVTSLLVVNLKVGALLVPVMSNLKQLTIDDIVLYSGVYLAETVLAHID